MVLTIILICLQFVTVIALIYWLVGIGKQNVAFKKDLNEGADKRKKDFFEEE
ncbi:MAG: hypothetical protein Aureis2KO_13550 [Aureisphaera sp.]